MKSKSSPKSIQLGAAPLGADASALPRGPPISSKQGHCSATLDFLAPEPRLIQRQLKRAYRPLKSPQRLCHLPWVRMTARINTQIFARRCLSSGIFIKAMNDGADQQQELTTPAGPPSQRAVCCAILFCHVCHSRPLHRVGTHGGWLHGRKNSDAATARRDATLLRGYDLRGHMDMRSKRQPVSAGGASGWQRCCVRQAPWRQQRTPSHAGVSPSGDRPAVCEITA